MLICGGHRCGNFVLYNYFRIFVDKYVFNKCIMVSYKGFDGNLHEPSCSEQEFKEIVIDAMNVAIDYCRRFGVERSNAIDIWEHSYESCVYK